MSGHKTTERSPQAKTIKWCEMKLALAVFAGPSPRSSSSRPSPDRRRRQSGTRRGQSSHGGASSSATTRLQGTTESATAASASAANQLVERKRDGRMHRTADRPLPAGRITPGQALAFAALTLLAGSAWLALLAGWPAALYGLATWLLYVVVYTPLKPLTTANTAVGAVAGAMPVFIGWSAGGNLILSLSTHLEKDGAGDPAAKDPIERENCRPDFVTLLSPWPNSKKIDAYPPTKKEEGKSKGMPPAFIGSARDDTTAPFTFAKAIQSGWEDAGDKIEFYEIANGGHGAFELTSGTAKDWMTRWLPWMETIGMWKKPN